jgi:dihydroxy-acid dehydratase
VVGHITPEAQRGGMIGLLKDGDMITIDAKENSIHVELSNEEIRKRKEAWTEPPLKHKKGILFKYARTVASASEGCVTDKY